MNSSFKTADHVVWNCIYHVVFAPKYRKKILYGDVRVQIGKILRKLAERKGVQVLQGTACPDHVHMVLSIPPKYSVAHIMGFLKGKSAILVHNKFSRRKSVTQKEFWARGYFIRTTGLDQQMVEEYIRRQIEEDQHNDGNPQMDFKW